MCSTSFTKENQMKIRPRKRVRFPSTNESLEKVFEIQVNPNPEDTWYNSEGYQNFRQAAHNSCQQSQNFSAFLDHSIFETSSAKQNLLDVWSHSDAARGLELFANPKLGQLRRRQRQRAIKAVIYAQEVARQENAQHEAAKLIAYVSSRETSRARKFALMMAKADANAARISSRRGPNTLASLAA
mmetsp:Transcript_30873/g.43827  ORF Transcript_30873/g.43827 Transcript_30873/m.43827 type:complete len:185 (+) Transcript_30873:149-703(+)|eukprot:CAMPEP_0202445986 /NCGR_PEP_ID=MMETSP1360-20130828/4663_1 /ASSEMBLY_ACC=CAM_ASM_000848 /TAXON_ID=515479 /ORGANISM="Licmophora paradoxa, Strain CCMP2313" /LENGTH=184 /DNA_ID=CAMNT_0049062401 /DNA_START=94 /DNA_END=648 /DNA_ORIENTATION=-